MTTTTSVKELPLEGHIGTLVLGICIGLATFVLGMLIGTEQKTVK